MAATPPENDQPVLIVGGGFSGAMLAARLAEAGQDSVLIDASGQFGLGVAYSTPFDGHLLNVRAGSMSALADDPGHFVRWLEQNEPDEADTNRFVPRCVFGRYVQHRLTEVEAACPSRIRKVASRVAEVTDAGVVLADGTAVPGRAVVLATGNPAPQTAGRVARPGIIPDPWAPGALDVIGAEDDILIIGTGLTMVDMVLVLDNRGWKGRAQAISRRGLMPRAHEARPDAAVPPHPAMTEGPLSGRVAAARGLSDRVGWRSMMEGLRPLTAGLWRSADTATRSRIVRHLRPWWDVHRHRIAPEVAAIIYRLLADDRLKLAAGRVRAIDTNGDGVVLTWQPRRGDTEVQSRGRWVIDCSGPGHSPLSDPVTGPLIASGRARMDALGLGLDLDDRGCVLDCAGWADGRLIVLGPPAHGAFWETIAVPDIRRRIEDLVGVLGSGATVSQT